MKARTFRALLALVGVIISVPQYAWAQGSHATPVHVEQVRREELQERRRVTGELRAVAQSRVATIEQGLVVQMPVQEGDAVQEGDVLAVLDARRLALARAQLQAQARAVEALVAVRAAERSREEHDLEVLTTIGERQAIAPKELADARADADVAAAWHEQAGSDLEVIKAQLDLVETRLEDMTIRAPFDGVVVVRHAERGQWLGEGDAIVDLLSTGRYEAWLEIPQRFAKPLRDVDAGLRVLIDATGEMTEPVRPTIVPLVDPNGRMFSAYVMVDDPAGLLAPGMSVTGWIPTGERREYTTVHRDAILRNEAGFYVYVARTAPGGPASAAPVSVTYLFATAERIAVQSPQLGADDLVVTEGNERLFPMMPISPIQSGDDSHADGGAGEEGG